jgi:hypothetical protein
VTQLHAASFDGETAVGRALIRRQRRVALDQRDVAQRNIQLVGDDLHEGGFDAGAEVDLSGIDGDLATRIDRKKSLHLIR